MTNIWRLINNSIFFSANYVLVLLSFDRVCALWTPAFYRNNCKSYVAIVGTLVVYVFLSFISWPTFLIYGIMDGICQLTPTGLFTPDVIHMFLRFIAVGFLLGIPFTLILLSNVLIIWKIRQIRTFSP